MAQYGHCHDTTIILVHHPQMYRLTCWSHASWRIIHPRGFCCDRLHRITTSLSQVHFDCIFKTLTVVSSREAKLLGGNRTIAQVHTAISAVQCVPMSGASTCPFIPLVVTPAVHFSKQYEGHRMMVMLMSKMMPLKLHSL